MNLKQLLKTVINAYDKNWNKVEVRTFYQPF